jgi:phosphoglycolate phosphatase-like HAD superfamily hydrolase
MSAGLKELAPGIFATPRAAALAEVADLVVFDVDGVLVNVHESFPYAIAHAVQQFLWERGLSGDEWAVSPQETAWFKAAGGFNSDWDLAAGAALIYLAKAEREGETRIAVLKRRPPLLEEVTRQLARVGGGLRALEHVTTESLTPQERERVLGRWDRARISRLCMEYYAGADSPRVYGVPAETYAGPGLMLKETPLVRPEDLPDGFIYGLYTGRSRGEVREALRLLGLEGRFSDDAMMTQENGFKKPSPDALRTLAGRFRPRLFVYAGDNLDDWESAARYESERGPGWPPCLFAGILGGSPGPLAWNLFQERGAELVAQSTPALMRWLQDRRVLAAGGG